MHAHAQSKMTFIQIRHTYRTTHIVIITYFLIHAVPLTVRTTNSLSIDTNMNYVKKKEKRKKIQEIVGSKQQPPKKENKTKNNKIIIEPHLVSLNIV